MIEKEILIILFLNFFSWFKKIIILMENFPHIAQVAIWQTANFSSTILLFLV